MILSSADILRVLRGSEIIRLSAKLKIVDGKPALSGAEGLFIYIDRFPTTDEFQATWRLYLESDGSELDDLVLAEIKKLLPGVKIEPGLMATVTTTELLSANTQRAPEAPKPAQAQADLKQYEERFQELVEDVQDRMLLVNSGRPGRDGRDGVNGKDGRNGRDIVATETNLEDLQNVSQGIAKEKGQVLTWDGNEWTNLYIPERHKVAGGGGAKSLNDLTDVDTATIPPLDGQVLTWNGTSEFWEPGVPGATGINGSEWRFSTQTTGSPSSGRFFLNNADPSLATEVYISEINSDGKDVGLFLQQLIQPGTKIFAQDAGDSDNAFIFSATANPVDNGTFITALVAYEGSTGSISNNKLCIVSLIGGGGAGSVSVIDDLLDVDTSTVAPQLGDILEWDGSQWVPNATAGTGIEEAPNDGKYYVRQSGAWVDLQVALGQITTPDTNVDGGEFDQTVTTATNSNIYDGGDFDGGGSVATDNTFLDGEVFTGDLDDITVDGGTAST